MSRSANTLETGTARRIRTPLDGPIDRIAERFGGARAKDLGRFLRFAIVGTTGALIDLGTLIFLQATILPPTSDLNVTLATSIAFTCAVLSNFVWNRFWVYPDSRSRSIRRQVAQFTLISITGWAARTTWVTLAYAPVGHALMPTALPIIRLFSPEYAPTGTAEEKLGTLVAQLIGMVVVMLWNFFANRLWTYNDVES